MTTPSMNLLSAAGGGVAAFSPTDIAGLSFWVDASDSGSISHTGGLVNSWTDKSGASIEVSATLTNRPTTGATTLNGLNVIDFGGSQFLSSSVDVAVLNATDCSFTAFIVMKCDSTGVRPLLSQDSGSGSGRLPQICRLNNYECQSVRVSQSTPIVTVVTDNSGSSFSAGVWGIARTRMSATQLEAFTNASSDGSSAVSSNFVGSHLLHISRDTSSGPFRHLGSIAEIVLYNSDLSAGQVTDVETYLDAKWGL